MNYKPIPIRVIIWCEWKCLMFWLYTLLPKSFEAYAKTRLSVRQMAIETWKKAQEKAAGQTEKL